MCMPGAKTGLKKAMNALGMQLYGCATLYVFWLPNLGHLDGQQVLLTPEPTLQSH